MMAGVRIDSPLMSRNIVEIFDIIESVSQELADQRAALGRLAERLEAGERAPSGVGELLVSLKTSTDYCARMLS